MKRYKKMRGFANMRGELFEMKKAAHLYLRSVNLGLDFQLAVNVEGAGALDDIVYKYKLSATSEWYTCFIQLKHKDKEATTLTDSVLNAPSGPFSLRKYLQSYRDLKLRMSQPFRDVLFEGDFALCRFIIYTNAIATQAVLKRSTDVSDTEEVRLLRTDSVGETILRPGKELVHEIEDDPLEDDFLDKLILMCGEPREDQLDCLIKEELGGDGDAVYRIFEERFRAWWRDGDTILERGSDILDITLALALEERVTPSEEERFRLPIAFLESSLDKLKVVEGAVMNVRAESSVELSCTKVLQALETLKVKYSFSGDQRLDTNALNRLMLAWKNGDKRTLVIVSKGKREFRDKMWADICGELKADERLRVVYVYDGCDPLPVALEPFKCISDSFRTSHLDVHSMESILDRNVSFQGVDTTFRDMFEGDLERVDAFLGPRISEILRAPHIRVGSELQESFRYYIPRTFTETNVVSTSILKDARETDKLVISGASESQLRGLCRQNVGVARDLSSKCSILSFGDDEEKEYDALCEVHEHVHWILWSDGKFKWIRSHGSTTLIKKHLEREKCVQRSIDRIDDVNARLVLLVAEPGMGKSTLMGHLAVTSKMSRPNDWVLLITLNEHNKLLEEYRKGGLNACEVLASAAGVNALPRLDRDLFSAAVNVIGNVVVLLDGYDEVAPRYSEACCDLVASLLKTRVRTIWITSRPSFTDHLERNLSTLPITLNTFTEEDQRVFFTRFWKRSTVSMEQLDAYVTEILTLVETSIKQFTGIPLQTLMLAEVFQDRCELPKRLDLLELLEKFVERKFQIYFQEKLKRNPWDADFEDEYREKYEAFERKHRTAALVLLVDADNLEKMVTKEGLANLKKFLEEVNGGREKAGIVTKVVCDVPQFVHRVFAEYFAAAWFAANFRGFEGFFRDHFFGDNFRVVRNVFDRILARDQALHMAVLDGNLERVKASIEDADLKDLGGRMALHLACAVGEQSEPIVEPLLLRADTDIRDNVLSWTPVQYAFASESFDVLELFLKANKLTNADVEFKKLVAYEDVWELAIENNYVNLLNALLSNGLSVNATLGDGDSLLHLTAELGKMETCRLLIQAGSDMFKRNELSETALHTASCQGHLAIVLLLLDNVRDKASYLNVSDEKGWTSVHLACVEGHADIVDALIESGADIKMSNTDGETPLHSASDNGYVNIVERLLSSFVDERERIEYVNRRDKSGLTALSLSRSEGHTDIIAALQRGGAHVAINMFDQMVPLYDAIRTGRTSDVEQFIDGIDERYRAPYLRLRDDKGRTPLHLAASIGNAEIVDILLQTSEDIFTFDNVYQSPLHVACENSHKDVVQRLVESIAKGEWSLHNLNATDKDGKTALHLAVNQANDDIVEVLIKAGARVTEMDSNNQSPLHFASNNGRTNMVHLLLDSLPATEERIKYVNAQDTFGQTALFLAGWESHVDIVDILIEAGADITLLDEDNRTLLHKASENGLSATVQHLVDSFTDDQERVDYVNALDFVGLSAIAIGCFGNHQEVVEILTEAGADLTNLNSGNMAPLCDAIENGKESQVQLLIDEIDDKVGFVNTLDFMGRSPLYLASIKGFAVIVDILLGAGGDSTVTDAYRQSPLHVASENGHFEVVCRLVNSFTTTEDKTAYVNTEDKFRQTAAYLATVNDHALVVGVLIKAGAAFKLPEISLIHHACMNGCVAVVQHLVDIADKECKRDYLRECDGSGESPMTLAATGNYVEVVRILFKAGANIEFAHTYSEVTLLHNLCRLGHKNVIRLLLDGIVDPKTRIENVNKCDFTGQSPLYYAVQGNHIAIVEMLLESGADVTVSGMDNFYRTSLAIACENGNATLLQLLIDNIKSDVKTQVNICDNRNGSLISLAAEKGYADIVDILIKAGADVKLSFSGVSHLHLASQYGHLSIVKSLVASVPVDERAEYVNAVDKYGRTALALAMPNVVDFLNSVLEASEQISAESRLVRQDTATT